MLCDLQGLTYDEIAAATGWPLGTVRSRIHRGRKTMRDYLSVTIEVDDAWDSGATSRAVARGNDHA